MLNRVLFILFSFYFLSASAKEYPMLHYTIEDGLPSNTIYDIYQSPDGFIWIGTDKGVSRFNGIKFENFTMQDGLADNECFYFTPDKSGRLWLSSYNGELCFYKDGIFHNAKNTPWLKLPFKRAFIRSTAVQSDGSITILFKDRKGFVSIIDSTVKWIDVKFDSKNDSIQICGVLKPSANVYKIIMTNSVKYTNLDGVIINEVPFKSNIIINDVVYFDQMGNSYDYDRMKWQKLDAELMVINDFPNEAINGWGGYFKKIYKSNKDYIISTDNGLYFNEKWFFCKKILIHFFEIQTAII